MRAGLGCLALLALASPAPLAGQGASYEQLQTLSNVLNYIRLNYVDSVEFADLVHAAIDGALESLDPHSHFVRRADIEREHGYEAGLVAGTGMVLEAVEGVPTVLAIRSRSPAMRSGIAAGDRLVSVNDTTVAGLTIPQISQRLLGDKGARVRLRLERGRRISPETVNATVKLGLIVPVSVESSLMVDSVTGYLKLAEFNDRAAKEVAKGITGLRQKGARRLILDLRGNPGGLVDEAVGVASLFLPDSSLVFRAVPRHGPGHEYRSKHPGSFQDMPLIVLVDEGSASASEALAGALQDHDRALIAGRRSFGKALIQSTLPVPPLADAVMLTVARAQTPSGRVIQRSYRHLRAEQYYAFAGKHGAPGDTLAVYRTDGGREVRSGGGIAPDLPLPAPDGLPAWFSVAVDSGWPDAVADSVAATLRRDRDAFQTWLHVPSVWHASLVLPFLDRIVTRLSLPVDPDSTLSAALGMRLATRVAEVRWGEAAAAEFLIRNDPDVTIATRAWGEHARLGLNPR